MKISIYVDNELEFEYGDYKDPDYDTCLDTLIETREWINEYIEKIQNE